MSKAALVADLMRGSRLLYACACGCVLLATLSAHIAPLVLKVTIDSVIGDKPPRIPFPVWRLSIPAEAVSVMRDHLWVCGLLILCCALVQAAFDYLRVCLAASAAESFARRLRNRLYDHIQRLPFAAQDALDTGDVIQRSSADVDTVRLFMETQVAEVARVLAMIGISVPILVSLDARLTVVSVLLLPVVLAGSAVYFFRVKTLFGTAVAAESALSSVTQENLTGIRLVKSFTREAHECERFEAMNEDLRCKDLRLMQSVAVYWGGSAFVCMLQIALVLVAGVLRAVDGTITIGDFSVFLSYTTMLVWPIRMLSDAGRTYVSLRRIQEILQRPQESDRQRGTQRPPIHGNVLFEHVECRFPDGSVGLRDIGFSVEAGQSVAVVGRTGSGKSTLVHLLPRLLDYSAGSIRIDGVELRTIDRQWIREHIGIVLQEPFLFSKSVRENIRMGAEDQPEHRILEAAHIADIHTTIENDFDQGYETLVGERGVTLSGGQRQRIAIARAIMRNPPILILDDALSAVDSETDRRIQQALTERQGRYTTFMISHRVSTISRCDLIVVLENGRITAAGTHDQLAQSPGLYQRICNIQQLLEEDLNRSLR
jgi:ATP-binding cassette subfamily B protein